MLAKNKRFELVLVMVVVVASCWVVVVLSRENVETLENTCF